MLDSLYVKVGIRIEYMRCRHTVIGFFPTAVRTGFPRTYQSFIVLRVYTIMIINDGDEHILCKTWPAEQGNMPPPDDMTLFVRRHVYVIAMDPSLAPG